MKICNVSYKMYHYFLLNNNGSCTTAEVSLESVQQLGEGLEWEGGRVGRKGKGKGGREREGGIEGRQIEGPGIICNQLFQVHGQVGWTDYEGSIKLCDTQNQ